MLRYLRLAFAQFRISLLLMLQYRMDFFVEAILSLFWIVVSLVPLLVLFHSRPSVAGWSWPEALIVVAWFTCLKGILDGFIQPSLEAVVEQIRKGTLDFLLLKPADAQFLVSTARFKFSHGADMLAGLILLVVALYRLGHLPSLGAVLLTLALLAGAVVLLYSFWVLAISLAFYVVKVDNLTFLFSSIFDAARWPASVFRGVIAFLFTFVIPLAVMTTFPALAILDRLEVWRALFALVGAALFALIARLTWLRALRHYTSAGG